MKTKLFAVAIALLALASFSRTATALDKGEEAPNFRFEAAWGVLDGAQQLTDLRGKVVIIELWKIH